MCEPLEIYYVENDPGVPTGMVGDPYAGLDEWTAERLSVLCEGKAIGGAQLSANVGMRDRALRQRYAGTLHGTTEQRRVMKLAAKNAMASLKPHVAEAERTLRSLMRRWVSGDIRLSEMRTKSAAALRRAYEAAREIGRRSSGLERMASTGAPARLQREEETWFRDAVREELGYWHRFLDEINVGQVTEERRDERIDAYIRSIRFMFEAARVQAMPDNVLLHWIGPKKDDPHICEGCVLMMEWTPFTKETIPAVPRDGSTPCLSNCRHRVVVRVARNFNEVIRRAHQLDRLKIETRRRPESSNPRARMVKKLQEVKAEAHGGRRRGVKLRGRAGNPFKGERLPSTPRYGGRIGYMQMQEATEDGKESVGVFLRLPPRIAREFPSLGDEDTSPPHCTLLFVGGVDRDGYDTIVDATREVCSTLGPLIVGMTDYGEFSNPAGQTIAHMIPRVVGWPGLADIHEALYQAVVQRGIVPAHIRDEAFKPHVTLAYLDGEKRYSGPRPTGTFRVDAIEVWGDGGDLGNMRVPFGGGPPVAVDESLEEASPSSPHRSFDSVPYSAMDLRDVARLLVGAAKRRDVGALEPLLDRVLSALEHTVTAIEGRPRSTQVAKQLRAAFVLLLGALEELPESTARRVRRFRSLMESV